MKKTKRFLSCMLACLMLFSALPVFATTAEATASASTPEAFACNFEGVTATTAGDATTASELTAEGFKWVTSDTAAKFKIVNDDTYGNTLGFTGTGSIGAAFDAPVTTGKVHIAFSFKAGTFGYVRPIGTLGAVPGTTNTNNIEVDGDKIMYIGALEESKFYVKNGSLTNAGESNLTSGSWNYIEIVVDLDSNSWSGYLNGTLVATTTKALTSANSMDPLPQLQGFYFYNGDNVEQDGLVDNLVMSYEPVESEGVSVLATDYAADADGGKIDIYFSDALNTTPAKEDISIIKCGAENTITVSDVDVLDHMMTVSYSGALEKGCEYAVAFADDLGINDAAYVYCEPDSEAVTYYAGSSDGYETFNDTTGYTIFNSSSYGERKQVTKSDYLDVFHAEGYTTQPYVAYVDSSTGYYAPEATPSDYALGSFSSNTHYRLLDIIPEDFGIETYEFDIKNSAGTQKLYALMDNQYSSSYATDTNQIASLSSKDWYTIRLDYDTQTKILYFQSGTTKKQFNMTNGFSIPLALKSPSIGGKYATLMIDNYRSYVTYTPLNVEKVRYIDASDNVTGLNTISPETTSVEITFSEAVTEASLAGITVKKNGSEDDKVTARDLSDDGKTAILTVGALDAETSYVINVPETVIAATNSPCTAKTYTVTTGAAPEGEYTISELKLVDANGAELAAGTTGTSVKVTAKVEKIKDGNKKVTVIYALYDGTTLVDADFEEITLTTSTNEIDKTFETDSGIAFTKCKAFVWDGVTSAVPLVTSYEK